MHHVAQIDLSLVWPEMMARMGGWEIAVSVMVYNRMYI